MTHSGHTLAQNPAAQQPGVSPWRAIILYGLASAPNPIQNISGLAQGPARLPHARLRAL